VTLYTEYFPRGTRGSVRLVLLPSDV
jgi:hypothetical protein